MGQIPDLSTTDTRLALHSNLHLVYNSYKPHGCTVSVFTCSNAEIVLGVMLTTLVYPLILCVRL